MSDQPKFAPMPTQLGPPERVTAELKWVNPNRHVEVLEEAGKLRAELKAHRELLALVVNDLVPIVEMMPEADDTTTDLYPVLVLVKQAVAALLPIGKDPTDA